MLSKTLGKSWCQAWLVRWSNSSAYLPPTPAYHQYRLTLVFLLINPWGHRLLAGAEFRPALAVELVQ